MIKNNQSKVQITTRNIKYYTDRNYKCNVGDIIIININTMPKMSHNIVTCICEICSNEKEIPFSKYNKNKERQGFYSCSKCSDKKRKATNIEKYGIENFSQTKEMKENNKKWMSSDEFKNKSKESLLEKYGVDSYSKTNEFKKIMSDFNIENQNYLREKRESTCFEKYGYKSILEIPGFKEKGMFERYGASYSFFVPEIKEKIQNINLSKFGHISPFGNNEIKNKSINKIIKLYGVDNVWKNKEMISFMLERKKELGICYKDDEIKNKYLRFRKKIVYMSYKHKLKLLEIWDGRDFYTGDFIKNNFKFHSSHESYPTIDHKISIFYGYINNVEISELTSINNLCWTTRRNNSRKSKKDIQIFQSEIENL